MRGPRGEGERNDDDEEDGEGSEEDNTITLNDYLSKTGGAETKQQVNDVKTKITDDQLKKELGKATLLETRKDKKNDDYTETVKKNLTSPVVVMNTEHADLLGSFCLLGLRIL